MPLVRVGKAIADQSVMFGLMSSASYFLNRRTASKLKYGSGNIGAKSWFLWRENKGEFLNSLSRERGTVMATVQRSVASLPRVVLLLFCGRGS